jgi:hypothetical protein
MSIAGGAFTDSAGNPNNVSSVLSINYDTAAPSVPGVDGTSPILTNDATPTLSGTTETGSTVIVTDSSTNPATQLASVVATNGTWSFDASTLSEGDHFISAVAVDVAGNTSASSTSKTWRIDSTPPTVSLSTVAGNDVVVRSEKDSGVAISGTVENGSTINLQFAGLTKILTPSNGSWTYSLIASDWTTIASTSPVVFSVTATDAAGNNASRSRSVTMNLASIAVPGDPDLNAADDTLNDADNITTQRTVRIDVSLVNGATPSHEAGQLLELIDDTGFVLASRTLDAADVVAGAYQFTLSDLNDDVYGVKSRVTSQGNSAGSLGQLDLVVDNRVPGTPGAPNLTDATDTGISARDNVTSTLRPIFKVAIDGIEISGSPLVAGDSILLLSGSTIVKTLTLSSTDVSTGYVLLQPNADLSEGQNSLTAKARSVAGVSGGDSIALSVLIDTTAQIAPAEPDLLAADDTGVSSSDDTTSIAQPNISVLLSGLGVVANDQVQLLDASLQVIGAVTVSSIDVANGYVHVLPLGVLSDGSQVVKVRVLDRAGNIGLVSPGLTLKIVTSVPNATEPNLQTASDSGRLTSDRITQRTTPTFVGTGTSGDTVQLYDGLQLIGTGQVVGGNWSITVSALADKSYTLRALVIDSAGNASSFSAGLGVTIDTSRPIAPVITGTNLLKSSATPSISGTAEAFSAVSLYEGLHLIGTTTADGSGNWTLTTSSLVDGSYSLKASATDIAGNTSTDSTTAGMLVDTDVPDAPTIDPITTFALDQVLVGTGEPGATLNIYDGANLIGSVTVGIGGSWTFTTPTVSNSSHTFTADQVDSVGNTSVVSSPARTISTIQIAALYGANGSDDNGITATASQYGAGGITAIDNAAKASLMNDIIDKLTSSAVDTQAEVIALAAVVKAIFETAAGETPAPALTPADLALLGITGVDQDNLSSVIAAIAGSADNGSGVDSLAELTTLVDAAVAAQRAAFAVISAYDGSNTAPTEADFPAVSVTGVDQTNLASINTVLVVLDAGATDSRSEVQAVVDTYTTILNGADGASNSAISLTFNQYQALGLTAITTAAPASLLSSVLDARLRSDVDTFVELQAIASVVARLAAVAAGGVASPVLTPEDFALIGVDGVTTSNLAAVVAAIAETSDNGSGIDDLSKLQVNVDAGISAARGASQAIISNYIGSNTTPALSDFENIGVTGVDAVNLAGINSLIAEKLAVDTDSELEVQAIVDAYAKVVALANGAADGGVPLTATELSSLGLPAVDAPAEVNLLNELIDIRPTSAVDSYQELSALASLVTRFIGESAGTPAVPALTPADFAALGLSGVTEANLAEVLAAIRASGADGSGIDSVSELRSLVDGAVEQSLLDAIDRISRFDGTGATVEPTLNDYANAGVSGVTINNLGSINSAFAEIGASESDSTIKIQNVISGYVAILNGADGTIDNDVALTQSDYGAMGLSRIDTTSKAGLLNEILDKFDDGQVDTYSALAAVADVVADIFLVATGGQALTALSLERLASIGLTGVTAENLALVVQAIANTSDDTTGVDSLADLNAAIDTAVAVQRAAFAVISVYDGTNTVPTEADFAAVSVTGVDQVNLASINTVLEVLNAAATDSRSEVQAIADIYSIILNGADGTSNSAISLTFTQYQGLGLTAITTSAHAGLLSSILDSRSRDDVDTYVELQAIASVVARLAVVAAGGVASPALTPADFALIGVAGVTTSNLAAVIAAISATANASEIDTLAKLQANVDAGIAAARGASQAIISNYIGSNTTPALSDFENIGVTGVDSANIAAINTFIADKSANDTDSQAEVQAIVDAYVRVVALANGAADGGVPLTVAEFSSLGLPAVDAPAEVNLLNELIDIRPTSAVDSYQELSALASLVTRFIGESAGTPAVPALTPADFAALGLSGVTEANLAEVLAAIRASGADGSGIDSVSEMHSIVDGAVAQSRLDAIDRISTYDATGATVEPTLNDYANAGVSGVTTNNLGSINSAFAEIGASESDSTIKIQNVVSGYVAILNGADGTIDNDVALTQSDYGAMGLTRIDTTSKAGLLNEILDKFDDGQVDTYSELAAVADVVADIFLVATGGQALTALSLERLASIGLTGVTVENLALVVQAIANSADDTTGVDSLSEIQAIVNQVRSDQANALGVISGYDGTNTVPSLTTFALAGVTDVDASNIGIINQYLAVMPSDLTDSVAEVQALVNAVLKLMICADGQANQNCTFTVEEFHAMGYLDIDTPDEVNALNTDLDVLDLRPNQEQRDISEVVDDVIRRFMPQPVSTTPPTTSPVSPVPTMPVLTTPPTTSPATTPVTTPVTTIPETTVPPTSIPTTTLPTLELLPGSNGVETPPDQAVLVIDGVVTDLIVTINEDNSATIEDPDNFVVRIIPVLPEDAVVLADGTSGIRVYRDRTVAIQGEGFAPDTEIDVWVNSTPYKLGTALTDSAGAFSKTFDVPPGIELGEHTLTLNGTLTDGALGRVSIGLVVLDVLAPVPLPTDDASSTDEGSTTGSGDGAGGQTAPSDNPGGEPYDPMSEPKSVVSLLGDMAGLMALAGMAVAGRRRENDSDDDSDSDERGSGEVSDVAVKHHSVSAQSKTDRLRMPRSSIMDRVIEALPVTLSRFSPMVGRVVTDGTYLRSLLGLTWIIMPVLGIIGGIGSAISTDFNAVMPSLAWLILIVVIGTFDALAGFIAASTFGLLIVLGGGINSADSIRGLLGIWVFSFAVPMLASASRPFRRKDAVGLVGIWDRTADFVMIVLFGAWAAGSMFGSLPGLTGFRPSYADDVSRIQIIVLVVLILRYLLENSAVILTPGRMLELSDSKLPDPSNAQVVISSLFRTASFTFVAIVFIGNNWALWTGAALYLLPKLVAIVDDKFPNSEALHRYLPRGILKVTFMMFVARWWGQLLTSNIDDTEKMLTFGFVFLGMPGFITTVLGWFGRSSSQPWKQNWFTRIGGLILLVVGFLIVRGVLLS